MFNELATNVSPNLAVSREKFNPRFWRHQFVQLNSFFWEKDVSEEEE
jgi:hypothetical protein